MKDRELFRLMQLIPEEYPEETAAFLAAHGKSGDTGKTEPVIRQKKAEPQAGILWRVLLPAGAAACLAVLIGTGLWAGLREKPLTTASSEPELTEIAVQTGTDPAQIAEVTAAVQQTETSVVIAAENGGSSAKTTAAPKQAAADTTKASAQNTNSVQKTNGAPTSGKTNKTAAQTTAKPAQTTAGPSKTTAAPKQTQPQVTTKTQPKKLTAPNLVGKTIDQVITDYQDTYPIFFAEYQYSDQPLETICEQEIPAGTVLGENDVIRIHPSMGPVPSNPVPDVIGMQKDEAVAAVRRAGYTVSPFYAGGSDLPFGTVYYVSWAPNETDVVNIAISDGLGHEIPNLVGMDYWNGAMTYYGYSLWCKITNVVASDYPDGTILEQSVAPGTPFNKHHIFSDTLDSGRTIIEVTIAGSGDDLVPVIMPDMSGVVFEDIYNPDHELLQPFHTLNGASISFSYDETSTLPVGTVVSQYPAPGTPVYIGSTIEIVISKPKNQTVSLENPVGKFLGDAVDIVRGKGCVPVITAAAQYDPTVPEYTVVRVEPGDLTNLRIGSEVRLIVSVSDPAMIEGF